eukprot:TRINITY_DN1105_c0_g1_i1.p1 TRINITY_DN1105_c0_g1~~TRINITY_DN1105_c0_g1_i1.p1  ORF type:complete len:154 (-),score=27.01 TRINITY_DN1105_c0_g1_i1:42-503(-)
MDLLESNKLKPFDPFKKETAASLAMETYLTNFIGDGAAIAIEKEPRSFLQSKEAYEYLAWYTHEHNTTDMKTFLNDFFFKIKTINAGLGDIPKADANGIPLTDPHQSFIDEFNKRYKYKVQRSDWPTENGKVVKRNAMKLVAKLLINSFYDII